MADEEEERELLLVDNSVTLRKRLFTIAKRVGRNIRRNPLLVFTVAGVVLGVAVGVIVHPFKPSNDAIELISFPGEIFLNMLKLLILPLIVFSLLTGLGSVDLKTSGLLGAWTCLYYFCTTFLAVILGIILVVSIHPGSGSVSGCGDEDEVNSMGHGDTLHSFLDIVRNMFPDNIIEAMYSQVHSNCVTKQLPLCECNSTNNETDCTERQCSLQSRDGMNILGIIIFTIAFGVVLNSQGEASKKLFEVFSTLNDAVMRLVSIVMCLLPVGIASLIAGKLVEVDSYATLVQDLGLYMVTILVGLFIHALIVLPLVYFIFTRRNPFTMIGQISQALLTAFGTSSSSATLPVTIKCLEDNCGVDARVTKFMLPIGATINMDGTALYEAVAAIFIAQLNGIDLSFTKIIVISITATLASVGAAGVPMAGLFTMIIVLTAVDLPVEDVSFIIAIDWLLDRFRTTVNVLGDSFGARIVERLSRKQLASQTIIHNGTMIDDGDDTALHSSGSSNNSHNASNSLKGAGDNDEEMELHEAHTSIPLQNTTKL